MAVVSVIMPVYNGANFIEETLQSLFAQTFTDWQLIVVDGLSSDNTIAIIEKFTELAGNRITLIQQDTKRSPGFARNIGLARVKTRYVAFLDADDLWHPEKLQTQLDFMRLQEAALSHTSYGFIDEDSCRIRGYLQAAPVLDLYRYMKTTGIGLLSAMIDLDRVPRFAFPDNPYFIEDAAVWITLLQTGIVSMGIDKNLASYRIRNGQRSSNKIGIALRLFRTYRRYAKISSMSKIWLFLHYAINGFRKRLAKNAA